MRGLLSIFLLALLAASQIAAAATLERVKENGAFKIGYREDAPPFSFKDAIGEPGGYSVDLCRAVAAELKAELGLQAITVEYVPVTTENRFEAIRDGRIDILCGATTHTLSRRALVDFSLPTFVDGASVLFRSDGPSSFEGLVGKQVGVRAATTTEEALRNTLQKLSIDAEVVPVSSHLEGLEKLQAGNISAYFADRAILVYLMLGSGNPGDLRLSDRFFTQEPYGLAVTRGDSDFRLVVDRTLARLYKSGEIARIFRASFGNKAEPTDALKALYLINRLPE